ncbi:MAG: hypothetical protein BWY82_01140 [Verrucomicrobia bacterium ADurb.Bin474]|nr:MAG: hypothetical protein BWY82_01140 [Verrucomicrobia bacterium ADurb.Bin474]
MPDVVDIGLVRNGGTGTDERHLALQHIDQLREFVEACFPDEPADGCNTRVGGELEDRGFAIFSAAAVGCLVLPDELLDIDLVRVICLNDLHRPEFEAVEWLSPFDLRNQ